MEMIDLIKKRINVIEKLFDNEIYKQYEAYEDLIFRQPEYKEYFLFLIKGGEDWCYEQIEHNSEEDLNLYQRIMPSGKSIRHQYESDKKLLKELENGND